VHLFDLSSPEQTRTALSHDAAAVMLLVRRHGLVCPAVVDYLNIVRPFNKDFEHSGAGAALLLGFWRHIYELVDATPPETWAQGVFRSDGHSVSVSDTYFIAHALNLAHSQRTTVGSFVPGGVRTVDGIFHVAQLAVKAIGFEVQDGNECLVGRSHMLPSSQISDGLFVSFEPHLDAASNGLPFIGYVNAINFTADTMVQYWRQPVALTSEHHVPRVRINHISASDGKWAMVQSLRDSAFSAKVRLHVERVIGDSQSSWTPELYVEENRLQWNALVNRLLCIARRSGVSDRREFAYPFGDALQVLQIESPERLTQHSVRTNFATSSTTSHASGELAQRFQSVSSTQRGLQMQAEVLRIVHELSDEHELTIEAETPLMEAGIDSLAASELAARLQGLVGADVALSPTLLFEQPTARLISAHLLEQLAVGGTGWIVPATPLTTRGICFTASETLRACFSAASWVGGCGRSAGLLLLACGDAVGSVPGARWCWRDLSDELAPSFSDAQVQGASHGSFVAGAQRFDAAAFHLSAAETAAVDPQQRLLLELSYAALHSGRLRRVDLEGSNGGTFVDVEGSDWHAVKASLSICGSFLMGDVSSVTCGRISYTLGLHGPCKSMDTACSSGLSAASAAASAVQSSESTFALGAGVSLKLLPQNTLHLVIAGTVSIDGRCKTFDARANGYVRAEALGALSLSCSDHALLRVEAILVRHDGRSASLTAPNGAAQRMLLSATWRLLPEVLSLCSEAHGTATALGDPTEIGALVTAYGQNVGVARIGMSARTRPTQGIAKPPRG
jgi:hypothetical protein